MCYLKKINTVSSINQIQAVIVRVITKQRESFNYGFVVGEIKKELKKYNVSESILNSYRIENMIEDTLQSMIDTGNISFFNNMYIPQKSIEKRIKYAFA